MTVFGYPIGGDRLSVTRGIVSRVDFRTYAHSVMDSHLTIQIDAAINPGNSGGPVMQQGKVVGVAFQGFSGDVAQNVGYMIPTPVIRHFLNDIADGHYDRYMDLSIGIFNTLNPAMRMALGLADDDRGVMVSSVSSAGVCAGLLKVGDVILSVDDHPVASDGFVDLEGERVLMAEVAERKFLGDTIHFSLLRDKKPLEVTVKFTRAFPYTIQASTYDAEPTYVVFARAPLSAALARSHRHLPLRESAHRVPLRLFHFQGSLQRAPGDYCPELILPDPINTYLSEFKEGVVDEINGRKIHTLREMSEALAEKPEFFVIKFLGRNRPLVLERSAVEAAHERIRSRYNVLADQNLEEAPAS